MFLDNSLKSYLNELASHNPTPGGGSASALVGALGCGLISMVCHYTLGGKPDTFSEPEVKDILGQAEKWREILQKLVDEDAEAYGKLSAAFKMPKQTDEEKQKRTAAVQQGLMDASLVPTKMAEACWQGLKLIRKLYPQANKNLLSDVGVAVVFLQASLQGAVMNIEVNLKSIKNASFVAQGRQKYKPFVEEAEDISKQICEPLVKSLIQ